MNKISPNCEALVRQELTRMKDNNLTDIKYMSKEAQYCLSRNQPAYDKNHAVLRAAPEKNTPKKLTREEKMERVQRGLQKANEANIKLLKLKDKLEKANPVSKKLRQAGAALRHAGGWLGKAGKLFTKTGKFMNKTTKSAGKAIDEATLITKRTLPTLNAAANCIKNNDSVCDEAAYNLCIDMPMTFAETGNNLKNAIGEFIPGEFGREVLSDKLYNKTEEEIINFCNGQFKDHKLYEENRAVFTEPYKNL